MDDVNVEPALQPWMWAEVPTNESERQKLAAQFASLAHGHLPAVVAVANNLLSDGDPLKITRADIQVLHEAIIDAKHGLSAHRQNAAIWTAWKARLDDRERLAAKLAALLPPEGVKG